MSDETDRRAHRARGHSARDAGKEFEDAVDGWLTRLRQQRVVEWWEANRPERAGAVFTGKSGADRHGILRGGVAMAMEVKSTRPGDKFERRRISEKQEAHLAAAARSGGLSLLALQFRMAPPTPHCIALIPWDEAPWSRPYSQWVLTVEDCAQWMVPPEGFSTLFAIYARRVDRG